MRASSLPAVPSSCKRAGDQGLGGRDCWPHLDRHHLCQHPSSHHHSSPCQHPSAHHHLSPSQSPSPMHSSLLAFLITPHNPHPPLDRHPPCQHSSHHTASLTPISIAIRSAAGRHTTSSIPVARFKHCSTCSCICSTHTALGAATRVDPGRSTTRPDRRSPSAKGKCGSGWGSGSGWESA